MENGSIVRVMNKDETAEYALGANTTIKMEAVGELYDILAVVYTNESVYLHRLSWELTEEEARAALKGLSERLYQTEGCEARVSLMKGSGG